MNGGATGFETVSASSEASKAKRFVGPVTLVLRRGRERGAQVLSWVFSHEHEALAVVRALRQGLPWVLVPGAFRSAEEALRAADLTRGWLAWSESLRR